MLFLDTDKVEERRKADTHGRRSTAEIEHGVARDQFVKAINDLANNSFRDPHLETLVDALSFALQHGVL